MQKTCPICSSKYIAYVRDVHCIRQHKDIPLMTCLECHSFWNKSDYVETEAVKLSDLKWGLSVEDRNRTNAKLLLNKLNEYVSSGSLLEIGCGIGTFLETKLQMEGGKAIGWEINEIAADYGLSKGLDIRKGFWSHDKIDAMPDLIICISVLEHLEEPRYLLEELCRAAIANNCSLFISVPFLDRDRWHYVLNPDPTISGTPFFDNDVHITHFSTQGLTHALSDFGCQNAIKVGAGIWSGLLVINS